MEPKELIKSLENYDKETLLNVFKVFEDVLARKVKEVEPGGKFAENLKKAIADAQMPISKIANSAGVSRATLYNYLKEKSVPNTGVIKKLAAALDCKASQLEPWEAAEVPSSDSSSPNEEPSITA